MIARLRALANHLRAYLEATAANAVLEIDCPHTSDPAAPCDACRIQDMADRSW